MSNVTATRVDDEATVARARRWLGGGWHQALLVFGAALILSCLATLITHRVAGDPFGAAAQAVPLVVGLVLAVAIAVVAAFVSGRAAGIAGALAVPVWMCFFCAWQLAGTPYPYGGVHDDIGRLTAFAERFTVSTASADQFVKGLPSDYSPLFPWLVGKTSVLTGTPAWRLIGVFEIVFTALAVTAAFLLWKRIFPETLALAVSVVPLAAQGDPRKAYEVMALCVITPWVLTTFGRWPDRARLHWLPAGLIGGLMVCMYTGYLVYAAMGIAAIVVMELLRGGRMAYLRHLVLTIGVAAVVSSWYLVPWIVDTFRYGSTNMWVRFWPDYVRNNLLYLPWSHGPLVSPLLIAGLALLVFYCRRHAWARYQLAIVLSTMVYRWMFVVIHHYTGNSGIAVHTGRLSDGVTFVGLLCGLWQLWHDYVRREEAGSQVPAVVRRMRPMPSLMRAAAGPVALATVLGIVVGVYWEHQRVGVPGFAQLAQATPLPNGSPTRYAYHLPNVHPARMPVRQMRHDVEKVLGRNALPVTLSYNEQISAYAPFYLYLGVGYAAANALSRWPDRIDELRRLAAISDPDTFARACADTKFGPIDVFILQKAPGHYLKFGSIVFARDLFASRNFAFFKEPNGARLFVRRGARVEHHGYPR